MKILSKPLAEDSATSATSDRPEVELLLCCARTHIDTLTAERIKTLLQQDINWEYLLQTALQHRVMPLLYRSLNTTCPEAVPQATLEHLRNLFYTKAQHNLFLTSELLKILNLFEAHGISAIPFKGAILAASAYDNPALRDFRDLDILIQERDVPKATDLLISQGYQPPNQLANAQEKPYVQFKQFLESAQYQGAYDFVRNDEKVAVELHWSLTKKDFPFPVDFKHLWEHIESVPLAGTTVPNFSPEDSLLFLCMHGSKHCFEELQWICDIAELLRAHQGINWEQVMEQSRILGSERMLLLGLLLASELLGTILPEAVLLRMQADPVAKSLSKQVCEQIFDAPLTALETYIFLLKARERLQDKVWYFFGIIMTPTEKEWSLLPLPKFFSLLYYLLRPIRLIGKLLSPRQASEPIELCTGARL